MTKEQHPTLFVFDGSIQHYEDGTMLELYSNITSEEWAIIIEDTIRYKIFLDCIKEIACPILGEAWDNEDEWYRLQLEVAVSRIRNIDPLAVAKYDQKSIKDAFADKISNNAKEVLLLINETKQSMREKFSKKYNISNL
jgi:hypothetical protein